MIAPPIGSRIPQLDALTGLRGIVAWFVVLYHIRLSLTGLLPAGAIDMMGKGYLAVDIFFILSGFVMWLNYGERLRRGGWGEAPRFWWKRFARIWPLHGAILAAMAAFAALLLATGRSTEEYPFAELPLHFLLLQNWGLTEQLAWNHPAWSISTEVAAYLLFPLLALAAKWERLPTVWLIGVTLILAAMLHFIFAARGYTQLGDDITGLGLWRCLAEFTIGIAACNLWRRWQGKSGAAPSCAIVGVAALTAGIASGLPETAFLPFAFASLLLALALDSGLTSRLLGSSPLRWLGDVSYATYLSHFFLFILFKIALVNDDLQLGWGGLAAYLLIVLATSGALYKWLEKPAQAALNARAPGFAARRPAMP